MDYKYNELLYGEQIYNNGFQTRFIKSELLVLVKYLKHLGKNKKDTEKILYEFCQKYIEGFNDVKYFKIIDGAIRDGRKKSNKLIVIEKIDITKNEIEYIDNLAIEHEYKKLLLAFLVKKKISYKINKINNDESAKLSIYFNGTVKTFKEIYKTANIIGKYKIDDMIYELVKKNILVSVIKGDVILDYIDKINKENDKVYMELKDFENVGYVFDYYKGINKVIKCANDNCGKLIKQKSNRSKYCEECSKEIRREQVKCNVQNFRNKNVIN